MAPREQIFGRHGIVAAIEPQDVSATVDELPPETVVTGGEAVTSGVSAPPHETRLTPHDALRNAAQNLDLARWKSRQCRDAVSSSRQAFNLALHAWNLTQPIQSVEDLKKEWIRSNQKERERRAEARQLQRPMTVGETARAMSGGNRRPGGGAAYRRGAFTRAEAARIEMNRAAANRLRAASVAAKLPSQR